MPVFNGSGIVNESSPNVSLNVTSYMVGLLAASNPTEARAALELSSGGTGTGIWATPRTLSLTGDATGSTTFDGSANFNLNVQIPALDDLQSQIDAIAVGGGGSAPGQLPANLAQLQRFSTYWFDAEDLASAGEGAFLSAWQDKNGRLISSTQSNALQLRKENGKFVAYFESDKFLYRKESQNNFNYCDIFLVLRHVVNSYFFSLGAHPWDGTSPSNQFLASYILSQNHHVFQDQHNYQYYAYSPRWTYGEWIIIHLKVGGMLNRAQLSDGYEYLTNAAVPGAHPSSQPPYFSDALVIGGVPWWNWWEGYFQKIIIFMSKDKFVLNEEERDLIKSYLVAGLP
ncbi:MAG: hypothetical protein HC925_00030 [Coleofasciculaceae cyanobacterium SM2_3_26]|nr:hypothetical protein [Coleofasciculaceae cyanobacterium SM2_3_26]